MTLQNKYQQVMDHVHVSDDMRERVLANVTAQASAASPKRTSGWSMWKKVTSAAAVLALFLAVGVVWQQSREPIDLGPVASTYGEVATEAELEAAVGFEVEEVAMPFEVTKTHYIAYDSDLAEVIYEGELTSLTFRKSLGDAENSGDFTTYLRTETVEVDGAQVTLKGTDRGYVLATWTRDGYSYSLRSAETPYSTEWWEAVLADIR